MATQEQVKLLQFIMRLDLSTHIQIPMLNHIVKSYKNNLSEGITKMLELLKDCRNEQEVEEKLRQEGIME